jgi:hypothetical protein
MDKPKDRKLIWTMITALTSAVIAAVSSIVYTGVSISNNNERWCDLLSPLNSAYNSGDPATAPQTELGRKVAASIHKLSNEFGC